MSKLKKRYDHQQSDQSITISKYITFDEQQTQLPQPIPNNKLLNHDHRNDSPSPKRNKPSAKKTKKSLKKANLTPEKQPQIGKPFSKRKTKTNKSIDPPKLPQLQLENHHSQHSLEKKVEKPTENKPKSLRKSKRKPKQQPLIKKISEDEDNSLARNHAWKSSDFQIDDKTIRQDDITDKKSNQSQQSSEQINFNKRLKKSKHFIKQQIDAILSTYAQDQLSLNYGNRVRQDDDSSQKDSSDLIDYELYNNKKQKKTKKQQGPKINNKFFKDIQCPAPQNEEVSYEGQEPPQDSVELIIQSRQPRKTFVNFQKIQQKAAHFKDKREMKVISNDVKIINQLKSTIRQVKDVDQVEIAVQNPRLAGKKGASGALHLKNNIQKQQKITKNIQSQSQKSSYSPLTYAKKTAQINGQQLQRTGSVLEEKVRKEHEYILKEKRKEVERGEFQKRLIQDIKFKRQTTFTSQEVVSNVQSTSLDDADFDIDLAEDALSNCSSQSGSRARESTYDRRMSVDSQNSRKSHDSRKSFQERHQSKGLKSNLSESKKTQQSLQSNAQVNKKAIMEQGQNSMGFGTNRLARNVSSLQNHVISQAKQSDISSSLPHANTSHTFNLNPSNHQTINFLKINNQSLLKQSVKKTYPNSYCLFDSQNQPQISQIKLLSPVTHTSNQIQPSNQHQQQQHTPIALNINKKIIKKNTHTNSLDQFLNQQSHQEKPHKNNKKYNNKRKNKKKNNSNFSIETYFEEQAEYSSSQEGHTDDEEDLNNNEDVDIDGNIRDLVDENSNVQLNEAAVRKKFLQDEEKMEQQNIQKIMKKMFTSKNLVEDTESEQRRNKRMAQAAQKNRLKDLLTEDLQTQKPVQSSLTIANNTVDVDIDEDSKNQRKIQQLEQQLMYGGRRMDDADSIPVNPQIIPLDILNTVIPEPRNHRASIFQRQNQNLAIQNRFTNLQVKKPLIDLKKNCVQQEIHNKRKKLEKRGQSTGNRNKIQKSTAIELGIRNTNRNPNEDVEI